jgi:hypothetical protein
MVATKSSRRFAGVICQGGLVVGMLLVVAGALWQAFAKPENVWSEAKAEEFRKTRAAWHDLQYNDPTTDSASESADRAAQRKAAQRQFEKIQAELDDAITTHRHRGTRLMYAGLAAIVLFGVGYLSARGE